jgi:hypothetical protein
MARCSLWEESFERAGLAHWAPALPLPCAVSNLLIFRTLHWDEANFGPVRQPEGG